MANATYFKPLCSFFCSTKKSSKKESAQVAPKEPTYETFKDMPPIIPPHVELSSFNGIQDDVNNALQNYQDGVNHCLHDINDKNILTDLVEVLDTDSSIAKHLLIASKRATELQEKTKSPHTKEISKELSQFIHEEKHYIRRRLSSEENSHTSRSAIVLTSYQEKIRNISDQNYHETRQEVVYTDTILQLGKQNRPIIYTPSSATSVRIITSGLKILIDTLYKNLPHSNAQNLYLHIDESTKTLTLFDNGIGCSQEKFHSICNNLHIQNNGTSGQGLRYTLSRLNSPILFNKQANTTTWTGYDARLKCYIHHSQIPANFSSGFGIQISIDIPPTFPIRYPASSESLRILIIEDNSSAAKLTQRKIQKMLGRYSLHIDIAKNKEEIETQLKSNQYHIYLVDEGIGNVPGSALTYYFDHTQRDPGINIYSISSNKTTTGFEHLDVTKTDLLIHAIRQYIQEENLKIEVD